MKDFDLFKICPTIWAEQMYTLTLKNCPNYNLVTLSPVVTLLNDRRHFLTFQSFEMFERDVGATDSGSIRQINVLTKYVAIVVSKQ